MSTSTTPASGIASVTDDASLKTFLATKPALLHVLMFTASWHEPSLAMISVVNVLAGKYEDTALFAIADAEVATSASDLYAVESVPTFLFLRGDKRIDRSDGADAQRLTDLVAKHTRPPVLLTHPDTTIKPPPPPSKTSAPPASTTATTAPALESRLKELINQRKVMLFMKGSPAAPRCGFSRRAVDLLNPVTDFGTFDILSDESVRAGLKTFSNWPTFPQIYVNGELIGGVDILAEMAESGELKSLIEENADGTTSAQQQTTA